ncbi:MAG: OmpA family protein [Sterolibacteriaceae bacterium]|nr:OmpA family protein [Candidatus Methylophosphatis haderslevensis]
MKKTISILIAAAIAGGAGAEPLSPTLACVGGCPLLAQAPRTDNGTRPIGAPRAALPEPALKLEPVFRSYLYAVFFVYGSARVGPRGRETVARLAAEARDADEILLTGRTDPSGNPAKNEALARRRSDAVRSAMLAQGAREGVLRSRIDTASSGDIAPGTWSRIMPKLDSLRARRVDIHISRKEPPKP